MPALKGTLDLKLGLLMCLVGPNKPEEEPKNASPRRTFNVLCISNPGRGKSQVLVGELTAATNNMTGKVTAGQSEAWKLSTRRTPLTGSKLDKKNRP